MKKQNNRIKKDNLEALDHWVTNRVIPETFTIYVGGDPRTDQNGEAWIGESEPGVDFSMADRFEQNLHWLSSIDPNKPILIFLSTCGGYVNEGFQMMSALLACPNPTTVVGLRHCRSMSSLIPLAADKFVMRPPAQYMYHYGTDGYEGLGGEQLQTFYEEHKKWNKVMLDIYVARLKFQGKFSSCSEQEIQKMLEDNLRNKIDVFLTIKEAIEVGFVDGIETGSLERVTEINKSRREAMWKVIAP